jgi:hypothetical protein
MPSPASKYRKLPGRGAGVGEASRLFLADDHLLLVTATGFSESYRRFYLRDIQAITARKTVTWAILNGAVGFILFWMVIGLVSSTDGAQVLGWSIAAGFFLALLLFNLFRGATCVCEIHTAVQSRRLSSVNRLRAARKLLARLRPVIEAAQGPLPIDELRRLIDQSRPQTFPAEAAAPVIRPVGW